MPQSVDLDACAREPIQIAGAIQPHGVLLSLRARGLTIARASANASGVLGEAGGVLGRSARDLLPELAALAPRLKAVGPHSSQLGEARVGARRYNATAYRVEEEIVLELEEIGDAAETFDELYPRVREFIETLQAEPAFETLAGCVARQVREITGFDRVMVYRFDAAWNGEVVAEDRNAALPSYLGLRFPDSDIPAQARELYRTNRLRLIPNADYRPCPIEPASGPDAPTPLDLSQSILRSVSPVHLEYMRNMGTGASMSVSVLKQGGLWGLISCHSRSPHHVPPAVRRACDLLAQIFALQLTAQEQLAEGAERVELKQIQTRLLTSMAASEDFMAGLFADPSELMRLGRAHGVAVHFNGRCQSAGATPPPKEIEALAQWLAGQGEDVFATDNLIQLWPEGAAWKDRAAGLLAVSVSKLRPGYVMWFRPEVVRTVRWGGDPAKPSEAADAETRLHPRRSFEAWKEVVGDRSEPWRAAEVEAAAELRGAIVNVVLRKAEELAELAEELARSNRELEAFSYSVSHDLRAPFRHIVGFAELMRDAGPEPLDRERLRHLEVIIGAAHSAGRLVDSLLSYSRMGRANLAPVDVDMNRLVDEVRRLLGPDQVGRTVEWRIGDLPRAWADLVMLRQVMQNLIGNALKFTRRIHPAVIEISGEEREADTVYTVRDNGVGFDMAFAAKLFGVFQRLHSVEEFEGEGIGLAQVRRIVERHKGRVSAEGALGRGAAFTIALPRRAEKGA